MLVCKMRENLKMKNQSALLLTLWMLSAGLCSAAESLNDDEFKGQKASSVSTIVDEDSKQLVIDAIVKFYEAAQNLSDTTAKLAKEHPEACGVLEFQLYVEVMAEMLRLKAIEYAKKADNAKTLKALCLTFGTAVVDMNADAAKCNSLLGLALGKMSKRFEDEVNSALVIYNKIFMALMQIVNEKICGIPSCAGKKNEV